MSTRAERVEERERRAEMARRYPACVFCKRPVVAGQTDEHGRPAHLCCRAGFELLAPDHPARRWTGPQAQADSLRGSG